MASTEPEGTSENVRRARESYEDSIKRSDDADALIRRADVVVGMIRGERNANHWADKTRRIFRGYA